MAVTVEQLKDVKDAAQEVLGDFSEKIKDVDVGEVVQHLTPMRKKRQARRGRRIVLLVLLGLGVGVAVSLYLRKRNEQQLPDVAPDAFGAGVMEQRGGDSMLIGSRTPDSE
jgi:hypothetical protein